MVEEGQCRVRASKDGNMICNMLYVCTPVRSVNYCDRLGRCFRFVFIYARTAVFLCCYRFPVSKDLDGWLSSRVVSVLDSGAEGPGSSRSRDAVG